MGQRPACGQLVSWTAATIWAFVCVDGAAPSAWHARCLLTWASLAVYRVVCLVLTSPCVSNGEPRRTSRVLSWMIAALLGAVGHVSCASWHVRSRGREKAPCNPELKKKKPFQGTRDPMKMRLHLD